MISFFLRIASTILFIFFLLRSKLEAKAYNKSTSTGRTSRFHKIKVTIQSPWEDWIVRGTHAHRNGFTLEEARDAPFPPDMTKTDLRSLLPLFHVNTPWISYHRISTLPETESFLPLLGIIDNLTVHWHAVTDQLPKLQPCNNLSFAQPHLLPFHSLINRFML